jgi:hypothetical protein
MLPDKEWAKIKKAIKAGTLKLRIMNDGEYEAIQQRYKAKAQQEAGQAQRQLLTSKRR